MFAVLRGAGGGERWEQKEENDENVGLVRRLGVTAPLSEPGTQRAPVTKETWRVIALSGASCCSFNVLSRITHSCATDCVKVGLVKAL